MDEATKEQTIAANLVGCWYGALTDLGKTSLSEHDLASLETMIRQVLEGDEELIAVMAARVKAQQDDTE